MLRNNNFENLVLESEQDYLESLVTVNENFQNISEAKDSVKSDGDNFFTKVKKFFKNLIQAIKKALNNFMRFFVNVYRKLVNRQKKVKAYIKENKEFIKTNFSKNGSWDKLPKDKIIRFNVKYDFFAIKKMGNTFDSIQIDNPNFKEKIKNAEKQILDKENHKKTIEIAKGAYIDVLMDQTEENINLIREQAGKFKDNSKNSNKESEKGIKAADKENKEEVKKRKIKASNLNKKASINQKICKELMKDCNSALEGIYRAIKFLKSQVESQEANKDAE